MKKSVNTRKIRTLYKYLLSYTIILLIPLIFFTFLINTSILNSLKDQTLDAVKNNLIRIREQTEQKFNEMERIALSISDNLHLCPYVLKKNYYKAYEGISELKSYLYGNDFIYDIMLYIRGDDRIYAASQSSDMQLMFENIYKFENWGFEELFHDINTFKTPVLRPSETLSVCDIGKRRVITYIYPIKPYDPYAVVIFLIDTGKMQELLGGIIKKTDENIMILDGQKNIIVSLDNEEILMDVRDQGILKPADDSTFDYMYDSVDDYFVSRIMSENKKMTFFSIVKKDNVMKIVNSIEKKAYIVVLAVLAIGAVIITAAIYFNYTPLYKLQKKIAEKIGTDNFVKDEILNINMAFDRVISLNDKLKKDAEDYYMQLLSELIMKKMAKGGDILFREIKHESLLPMDSRYYKVAVFKYMWTDAKIDCKFFTKWVWNIIRSVLSSEWELYGINNVKRNHFIVILCYGKNSSREASSNNLYKQIKEVCDTVCGKFHIKMAVGVGNEYKEILSIGKSHTEAMKALWYGYNDCMDKESSIVFFDDIDEKNSSIYDDYIYPYDELKKISFQIRCGNYQNIKGVMKNLFDMTVKKDVPDFFSKCIAYDIFNMLIKTAVEESIDLKTITGKYADPDIFSEEDSPEKLFETLNIVCEELCRRLSERRNKENPLLNQIMEYVQKNYADYCFSIEKMADDLNISTPYLSQFFKESTGDTLTEYIWMLKIKKAMYLLETTDLCLKDIVEAVGYVNVSSFGRKFKKEQGVTPGEYRDHCRKMTAENLQPMLQNDVLNLI